MKIIDSSHSQLLARAMDTYAMRQRVTSTNVANADTPGFKKHEVQFENALQEAQGNGGTESMKKVTPSIVETDNKVVLEDELLEMADTQIRVEVVTRSLRHHFDTLRNGITGRNQ
ncbi:flagellar basal body protein [Aliifodinibius sp. S!AR15-10]|uniref:flagellar basal body rod protein FlgB n=1 Tax=Aliifodinibius sp. S!AR15-10 TaxID=2950437 RepID=UPI002863BBF8|nr:flagellar basal body protein [Aliifodinibius sp. S!AR15-10]MDR8394260.1 flagellar basal body protein [Aliifodinibius sp. S!AR15-10]